MDEFFLKKFVRKTRPSWLPESWLPGARKHSDQKGRESSQTWLQEETLKPERNRKYSDQAGIGSTQIRKERKYSSQTGKGSTQTRKEMEAFRP